MKRMKLLWWAFAVLVTSGTGAVLRGADDTPPAKTPNREELREQLKNLSPEEREAKIKELREKRRAEMEKTREELKKLPPEERAAKIKELREKRAAERPELKNLTPEEREAKRKEMKARMEQRLADLRKKKVDGTITPQEEKRLERMEEMGKRLEQNG
jgi:translation initiation factor 3 subunit A